MKAAIQHVLFDASGTLIYKPTLLDNFRKVLSEYGYEVSMEELSFKHKLITEVIVFPDRTSKDFYHTFNAEVLFALGILPNDELLAAIFSACSYLPWEKYLDTSVLSEIDLPISILSNFNATLTKKIDGFFGLNTFEHVLISEVLGVAKPKLAFYKKCVDVLGINPEHILYIGDSLKLDILPAQKIGMQAYLIDRDTHYKNTFQRLDSLDEILTLIGK
ncbi:MAG: HAD family hydrolase [Saprospiraceae bacterium]|nr:HAD family hydrolase [Saprospiraceae bacterium]